MSIETALVAIAAANVSLRALLYGQMVKDKTGNSLRFFPDDLPQEVVLPAISFSEIDLVPAHAMTPVIVNNHGRYQFNCCAASSAGRTLLRNAVIAAFDGYSGDIGGETIKSILFDSQRKSHEQPDTDAERYVAMIDFVVDMA